MRKIVILSIIGITLFCILSITVLFVYTDITDWTLRPKEYGIALPLKTINNDFAEIEQQAKAEAVKLYENAYLTEINWVSHSNDGFEILNNGTVDFIYCAFLGAPFGYERYARCKITVCLDTKEITRIKIYGNKQLGGGNRIKNYIDNKDISKLLYEYLEKKQIKTDYKILRSSIDIYADFAWVRFQIKLSDDTTCNINGKIEDGVLLVSEEN